MPLDKDALCEPADRSRGRLGSLPRIVSPASPALDLDRGRSARGDPRGHALVGAAVEVQTAVIEAPEGSADGSVLNATGYVVARRLATVSSRLPGRIDEVLFEEGTKVAAGQVLARLDTSTARAEYVVAQSDLGAARKRLREIEVRLAEARRNRDRNQSLVASKLVAQSVLDASEAEVGALEARLDAERANVKVAESSLALQQQTLDDYEVRAPFAGVVISKDAQPGEMVSPMSAGGGSRAPVSPRSSTWTRARSRSTSTKPT